MKRMLGFLLAIFWTGIVSTGQGEENNYEDPYSIAAETVEGLADKKLTPAEIIASRLEIGEVKKKHLEAEEAYRKKFVAVEPHLVTLNHRLSDLREATSPEARELFKGQALASAREYVKGLDTLLEMSKAMEIDIQKAIPLAELICQSRPLSEVSTDTHGDGLILDWLTKVRDNLTNQNKGLEASKQSVLELINLLEERAVQKFDEPDFTSDDFDGDGET